MHEPDKCILVPGTKSWNFENFFRRRILKLFFTDTEFWSYSDELFKYSTTSRNWTKLDADTDVTGTPPSPRSGHSMTTVGQDVYVFGGMLGEAGGVKGGYAMPG